MALPVVVSVRPASVEDAGEILTVQRAAFVSEAQLYDRVDLPPLTETLGRGDGSDRGPRRARPGRRAGRPARAAARGFGPGAVRPATATAYVGRIAAAPDLQGTGIGSALLTAAERLARERWPQLVAYELFTGASSARNIEWYERMGYGFARDAADAAGIPVVVLRKPV